MQNLFTIKRTIMKKRMITKIQSTLIITCLTLLTLTANGQSDVDLKGYVVTNSNDTIRGEIFDMQLEATGGIIRVEYELTSTELKFKDCKAYKRGHEFFVRRKHNSFIAKHGSFMQVIITGDVVLYRLDFRNAALPTEDHLGHDYYVEKAGGYLTKVDRSNFQNSIMPIIADKAGVKEKVEKEEWVYGDLVQIVKLYNKS